LTSLLDGPRTKTTLHTADGIWGSPPHLEGSFPDTDSGVVSTEIWVFVVSITKKFILGLDILHAYDASVALGRQTLSLADEEVSLWRWTAMTMDRLTECMGEARLVHKPLRTFPLTKPAAVGEMLEDM
jgi:hypothetical protein